MKSTEPTLVSLKLATPQGVVVTWSDGHQAAYSYAYLRQNCPCAMCRDHPPEVKTSADPFPIYGKGPIAVTGASPIGHYAIQFQWNDGHAEGIYSYSYLREICPCEQCRKGREESHGGQPA